MHGGGVGRIGEASADHVDLAINSDGGGVIARLGKRRGVAPRARRRIENLMDGDRLEIASAAPDRMDFAVEHREADGPARAAQGRERPPVIGRGIVFEHAIDGVLVLGA